MRSPARIAVFSLLTLICFSTVTFAQAPAKQPAAKVPRGSISGRITIKEKPAAGVMVGLRRSDYQSPFDQLSKATTDQDGVYRITNVTAGSYYVILSTPAYVCRDTNYNPQTVVVGEDENVENINYTLVRGGVITGKITDADGRPVIQMQVDIFNSDLLDKQAAMRQMYPVNTVSTDDRGIYRVFGLPPGKYKIAAGRSDEFGGSFNAAPRTYKQVFHPDVSDVTKATIIEVSEGGEARDIDISLARTMQTFSVSGHVINNETGLPVPNVRYGLTRIVGERSEYVNGGIAADSRGDFVVEGLLPGKYDIIQYGNEANELRLETTSFDVIDQDITDLPIKLAKGASISGVVVLESDDKAARSKLSQLQLRGFISVGSSYSNSFSSMLAADGGFRFSGLQMGAVNLTITEKNMPFPPKGFAISRIERDGVVVQQLRVKDGETITGVKIVVSYGTATLRGVINVENGALPVGARFVVRLTKPGENTSNLRSPQVDARGHFLMEGIPAGLYEVVAYIPNAGRQIRPSAKQTVTLTDGVVTDVTLTVDLAP
jgi:5-hydroxyisourate hydrolase-like protein (transthyretin family)